MHDTRDVLQRYVKRTSRAHKAFVALILLGGAVLRAWPLNAPITVAEATSYLTFATQSFNGIVSDYSLPSNHILHTLLVKASTGLFGVSTLALRLPSFLASVMVLPLLYVITRSLFNRYIALMAMAMVAALPQLIEVGSLANGYSMTWCALLAAMAFGRHMVRESNPWSAAAMGIVLAFGMWSVPGMIYPALTVLLWVVFSFLGKYRRSVGERMAVLIITVLVFVGLTLVLYLPVVIAHGADQLFHHVSEGERTWKNLGSMYDDRVIDFWVFATDPQFGWLIFLGFAGLFHAAYISGKFRALVFALVLGCVPLSVALLDPGHPAQWAFSLIIFCIGSSMALFYLLKLVQEKMIKSLGKRTRTAYASVVLFVLFAIGTPVSLRRMGHLSEARAGTAVLKEVMRPGDHLCCDARWETSLMFELMCLGFTQDQVNALISAKGTIPPSSTLWVALGRREAPSPQEAIIRCGRTPADFEAPALFKDWQRLEIFAARKR